MEFNGSDIVERVGRCLKELGVSKPQMCSDLGVSHSTLDNWKNGLEPSVTRFYNVAEYIGVDPYSLLTGEKEKGVISDPEEQELIDLYRLLDGRERMLFMSDARGRRELHIAAFGKEAVEDVRKEIISA